jgi:RNA polymerase sigma-70 factor (ECF subfamily)
MAVAGIIGRRAGAAVAQVSSFADLVRANQSMVFSIALHFLRDRAVAEEIAQDVFLELHRHFHELESDAHVAFWLKKVTGRRCIDAARKRKYRAALALEQVPEPQARDEHPQDPLLNRTVQSLIAALPEMPRMIVILRYQEEMMPEEIAKVLDMPVTSVKSHLTRALAALRERLNRINGEGRHG